MRSNTYKNYVSKLCFTAMAVVLNLIGGQIALLLKLPVYLDCIGTILTGALLGPVWGMAPNFLSGIIMGFTVDIYSLYFAPVGIIVGFMAGITGRSLMRGASSFSPASLVGMLGSTVLVSVPGTIVAAVINAILFGGVTSSGSSVIVQLLSHMGIGLTASIFIVQFLTDYLDRVLSVLVSRRLYAAIPSSMKNQFS